MDIPMHQFKCAVCKRDPREIPEYVSASIANEYSGAIAFVVHEEGTFDSGSGYFLCDEDYIKSGMPSSPEGWKATPENLRKLGIKV